MTHGTSLGREDHTSKSYSNSDPYLIDVVRAARIQRGRDGPACENLLVTIAKVERDRAALHEHAATGAEHRFRAIEKGQAGVDDRVRTAADAADVRREARDPC